MPLKIDELNLLKPYEYMDSELEKFRVILVKRFKRIKLAKKGISKVVRSVYEILWDKSYNMFFRIAAYYYEIAGGKKKRTDWVLDFLEDYDFITGYQYEPEWERKRARTYEMVMAAREDKKIPDLKRPVALLNQQVTQKAIEIVDEATIMAYKEQGVKYIKWKTMRDNKVCAECEERDGKIFAIEDIPDKHYNCRCWFERYEDKSGNT